MKLSLARQRLMLVGALLAWCSLLVFWRFTYRVDAIFIGLWWNLFLAVIPLLASAALTQFARYPRKLPRRLCFVVWLLFFPNAPYILTDFIHLRERLPAPLWLDATVFVSFAGAGLILGYLSLAEVQAVVQRLYGKATGWAVALASLMLCGAGMYMGRFLRWNSWQVLHPRHLIVTTWQRYYFADLPSPFEVVPVYVGGLILGYLAFHILAASVYEMGELPE